jgi:hypothetical protein
VNDEVPSSERDPGERDRSRLERLLPELIKRALEAGLGKLSEGPENVRNLVSELKLPKEALHLILSQLDETKNGLYRAVAREIRDFLEHTNLADELAKVLTTLTFEIKTEVRFLPNEAKGGAHPDVKARVRVKRSEPPRPESTEPPNPEPEATEAEPNEPR